MPALPPFTIAQEGTISVVRFSIPTLADSGMLRELSQALTTRVRADDFRGLVLNMEGVKFIVSAFLNVVLTVDREMRAECSVISCTLS